MPCSRCSAGPSTGWQLREEFEARTGEVWPLNVGQVYTTLQRLERDGLVESDGDGQDGPQKGFRIDRGWTQELTGVAVHAVGHELATARRAGDESPAALRVPVRTHGKSDRAKASPVTAPPLLPNTDAGPPPTASSTRRASSASRSGSASWLGSSIVLRAKPRGS